MASQMGMGRSVRFFREGVKAAIQRRKIAEENGFRVEGSGAPMATVTASWITQEKPRCRERCRLSRMTRKEWVIDGIERTERIDSSDSIDSRDSLDHHSTRLCASTVK